MRDQKEHNDGILIITLHLTDPHGGGNHQHIGKASTISRFASAGQKAGLIAYVIPSFPLFLFHLFCLHRIFFRLPQQCQAYWSLARYSDRQGLCLSGLRFWIFRSRSWNLFLSSNQAPEEEAKKETTDLFLVLHASHMAYTSSPKSLGIPFPCRSVGDAEGVSASYLLFLVLVTIMLRLGL